MIVDAVDGQVEIRPSRGRGRIYVEVGFFRRRRVRPGVIDVDRVDATVEVSGHVTRQGRRAAYQTATNATFVFFGVEGLNGGGNGDGGKHFIRRNGANAFAVDDRRANCGRRHNRGQLTFDTEKKRRI